MPMYLPYVTIVIEASICASPPILFRNSIKSSMAKLPDCVHLMILPINSLIASKPYPPAKTQAAMAKINRPNPVLYVGCTYPVP